VTDADLAAVLRIARTIAVVGLSPHAHRRSYATLGEAAAEHAIDIVDVFRRSEFAGAVVDQALPLRPRLVFLQLGVTDVAAADRARAAGVPFIQDRCLAVEHQRLVA
jgi:predicted CoA-binding protein